MKTAAIAALLVLSGCSTAGTTVPDGMRGELAKMFCDREPPMCRRTAKAFAGDDRIGRREFSRLSKDWVRRQAERAVKEEKR